MQTIKFEYLPDPIINPKTKEPDIIYRPKVTMRLAFKHNLCKYSIVALVDTGADRNLFPAYLGELVGIKIKTGDKHNIMGIGDFKIEGYGHDVKLYLDNVSITTRVYFSYEHQVPLLGRIGFFDKFKRVIFNENEKYMQVEKLK